MKRIPIVLLALIAVLSLGFALWQRQQGQTVTADNSAELAKLRQQLWDAEKKNKSLAAELAAARSTVTTAPAAPVQDMRGGAQAMVGALLGSLTTALDNPETRRLAAIQQKAQLDSRYAALFKRLNLSPDQLDKFKNLLVDRQSSGMDVLAAARAQGIDPLSAPGDMRNLANTMQAQVDAEIRNTLGDAAYEQYKTYDQTLPQRSTVNQLEQRLSYSSTPLTADQVEQMVGVLAATSPQGGGAGAAGGGDMVFSNLGATAVIGGGAAGGGATFTMAANGAAPGQAAGVPISNDAVNQSQSVLTGPQLAALQQLQQEQKAQQQAQQQVGGAVRQTLQQSLGGRAGGGGRAGRGN